MEVKNAIVIIVGIIIHPREGYILTHLEYVLIRLV